MYTNTVKDTSSKYPFYDIPLKHGNLFTTNAKIGDITNHIPL